MIYKFFIGTNTVVKCDKVVYKVIKLKNHTFKHLVLYSNGIEIGTVDLDDDTKIKFKKEKSSEFEKVYFLN